ncbi:hypothetical protein ACX8XP_09710 [Calditrichota bacterium LG25]
MKEYLKYLAIFLFIFPLYLFSDAIKVYNSERAQVEASIAINPTNSKNLIGTVISMTETSKHIDVFYSFDKGNSWTVIENISGEGSADPVICFDQDGIAYLVYQIRNIKSIFIKKSFDGGQTWSNNFTVIQITENNYNVDKPWMAIDPVRNSNGYFDIYISYTKTNDVLPPEQGYSVRLLKSSNRGENFTEIYSVNGYYVGSTVSVGKHIQGNGEKDLVLSYICLQDDELTSPFIQIKYGFKNNTFVHGISRNIDLFGNKYREIKGGIRIDSYPRLCVDIYRGDYYLVWANGSNDGFSDLRMFKGERQNDGSLNWIYKGIVINEIGFQFDPTISVSQDGVVSILYYSSENNSESTPIFTYLRSCIDGSCNFSNRQILGYNDGFIIQQDSKFLGDYQGLVSWYDNVFGLFCQSKSIQYCEERQIYFQTILTNSRTLPDHYVKVKVDQQDENGISFGRFKRWNQNKYTSYIPPLDFLFEANTTEIIEAQQTFKNGTYERYNNFEQIQDIKNHGKFLINNDQNVIRAKFKNTSTAKLKAFCVSGNVIIRAKFKDPWLLLEEPYYNDPPYGYRNMGMDSAEFREFNNELNLTHESPYKGVFLDQAPDPNDPNKPYYSVKAEAQQPFTAHGQQITGYFLGWEGTDVTFQYADQQETPLVFHAANAEARAVYKGHLASSAAGATGYNNGRRAS